MNPTEQAVVEVARFLQGVVLRQGPALDRAYLEPRLKELAEALGRPEIWTVYEEALGRAGRRKS